MVKPLILTGQIADKTDLITPLQKLLASKKLCYQASLSVELSQTQVRIRHGTTRRYETNL